VGWLGEEEKRRADATPVERVAIAQLLKRSHKVVSRFALSMAVYYYISCDLSSYIKDDSKRWPGCACLCLGNRIKREEGEYLRIGHAYYGVDFLCVMLASFWVSL
jgi:hypothetical protein